MCQCAHTTTMATTVERQTLASATATQFYKEEAVSLRRLDRITKTTIVGLTKTETPTTCDHIATTGGVVALEVVKEQVEEQTILVRVCPHVNQAILALPKIRLWQLRLKATAEV